MILPLNDFYFWFLGILHVCGDDPSLNTFLPKKVGYSPRMWRWSRMIELWALWIYVFSTYVEMIPPKHLDRYRKLSILHVCGDDPKCLPRSKLNIKVFSTYVEMIRIAFPNHLALNGILHVCGDDPEENAELYSVGLYSPRMWRWSYNFTFWDWSS